jgi:hypothetical protein
VSQLSLPARQQVVRRPEMPGGAVGRDGDGDGEGLDFEQAVDLSGLRS